MFFQNQKWSPTGTKLSISHIRELFSLKDTNEINYYLNICIKENLTREDLKSRINSKEYSRLDEITKSKLIKQEENSVIDFIKNPILIKNNYNYDDILEKLLQKLIIEDITSFMRELGNGFSFINNEYKIKLGDKYNYIDLLLYNIEFNCYVVIELKVTKLRKEHIGQIQVYMKYIDKNLKKIDHGATIGIIICKKDNKFILEYCSDNRILAREYNLL